MAASQSPVLSELPSLHRADNNRSPLLLVLSLGLHDSRRVSRRRAANDYRVMYQPPGLAFCRFCPAAWGAVQTEDRTDVCPDPGPAQSTIKSLFISFIPINYYILRPNPPGSMKIWNLTAQKYERGGRGRFRRFQVSQSSCYDMWPLPSIMGHHSRLGAGIASNLVLLSLVGGHHLVLFRPAMPCLPSLGKKGN